MTLPGLKTNRTTTHNTAHNPHSNPTPEWLHLPQQYEPGEKSRVPSAVPDHCRPPELCPSVSCALSCVPVSAERVPGSGVPHSSHPCLPGCTWARTRAKKPPVIPLTSALPRNRSRPGIHRTRKSLSSSHSKGWDGMNSFPAPGFPAPVEFAKKETQRPSWTWLDGGEESHISTDTEVGRSLCPSGMKIPSLLLYPSISPLLKVGSAAPLSLEAKHSPEEKHKATTCPIPAPTRPPASA